MIPVILVIATAGWLVGHSHGVVDLTCPPFSLPIASSPSTEYTELTSGPRTIQFIEAGTRPSGSFKISILYRNTECVLLDNIPSNQDTANDLWTYAITVEIPDFECRRAQDNCRLFLQGFSTPSPCVGGTAESNSTAFIEIRSTTGNKPFTCPDNSRKNKWPYTPTTYTASLEGNAIVQFTLMGRSLTMNATFPTSFSGSQLQLRADGVTDPIFTAPVPTRATRFTVDAYIASQIMDGRVTAVITSRTTPNTISGRLTLNNNLALVEFCNATAEYSAQGWLVEDLFLGQNAFASFFIKPFQYCFNTTRYFGSIIQSTLDGGESGGTAGIQLTENRVWFSIDLYNMTSPVIAVELRGQATAAISLTPFWRGGAHVDGIVSVSDDMWRRIVTGLSSIWIATDSNRGGEVTGTLQEGMTSFLGSGFEVPPVSSPSNGTGTAYLFFSTSGELTVHLTLNNLTSPLLFAHLHSPAFQGLTSPVEFDLSRFIRPQAGNNSWTVSGTLRNMSSSQLLYFRGGLFYLNMHTSGIPTGELRGQLTVVGDLFCQADASLPPTYQCYWSRLDPVNVVDSNQLRAQGDVALVLDRVLTLQYSASLWNLPQGATYTLRLQGPRGRLVDSVTFMVSPSSYATTATMVESFKETLSVDEVQWAEQGLLVVDVTGNNALNWSTPVPPLRRNTCPQRRYMTDLGGDAGWTLGVEYPGFLVKVLMGDSVNFTFAAPYTVYLMDNKNRYDGCVFRVGDTPTAQLLASPPMDNSSTTFIFTFNESRVYYFASEEGCNEDPPLKVAFNATAAVEAADQASLSFCAQSSSSVVLNHFTNIPGSKVLIATLVGVVVGVVLLVVLVVLAVALKFRNKESESYDTKKGGESGGVTY